MDFDASPWGMPALPEQRAKLPFEGAYSEVEMAFIREGFRPCVPEQRWVIRFADDILRIRRNSLPYCKWEVRFAREGEGWAVASAWVNRDPRQYGPSTDADDLALLARIVGRLASGSYAEEARLPFSAFFSSKPVPRAKE